MIIEELLKYIESERKAGKDDARIRETLVADSWTNENIDEGFKQIKFKKNNNRIIVYFSLFYLFFDMMMFAEADINQIYFLSFFLVSSIVIFYLVKFLFKTKSLLLNIFFILYFTLSTFFISMNALGPAKEFIGISRTVDFFFIIGAFLTSFMPLFLISMLGLFQLNKVLDYNFKKTGSNVLRFLCFVLPIIILSCMLYLTSIS